MTKDLTEPSAAADHIVNKTRHFLLSSDFGVMAGEGNSTAIGGMCQPGNDSSGCFLNIGFDGQVPPLLTDEQMRVHVRKELMTYHNVSSATLIALYAVTFTLGFIGNVTVIHIFVRNSKMRTVTNSFLVNLAVCDLMVVLLCMPFSMAMEVYANWVYGAAMCKIVNFSQGLSVASSIFTMSVISAERFYAIRRPLKARAFMSRARIRKIIGGIWILAAVLMLPIVFVRREAVLELAGFHYALCRETWPSTALKHLYSVALLVLLYIGPVAFICVGYLHMGLNLWRRDARLHASESAAGSENARSTLAGRRKVARMLFILALLFLVSWLPLQVLALALDLLDHAAMTADTAERLTQVHKYALWLGHLNSSINPICYCVMSASFKNAVYNEMRRCCCRKPIPKRDAYRSMSMSLTVSTSNGGARNGTVRMTYRPVTATAGTAQDPPALLRNISYVTVTSRCDSLA